MMVGVMDVLIVEDEMLLAMDIEAIVEDAGHRVLAEAACLREVEELPSGIMPQLAFVDMNLANGSNGLEVCQLIQTRWPETIIVFVTANVSKIPADFAGGHGVIEKPFTNAGMVTALKYLADGVFDPPPSLPRPSNLTTSPHLEKHWATT